MLHRTRPLVLSILLGICIPGLMYAKPAVELDPPVRKVQPVPDQPVADASAASFEQPTAVDTMPTPATQPTIEVDTPLTVESQEPAVVNSLPQLDAENQKLGNWIRQGLASLPEGTRIRLGQFLIEGEETPLGLYWQTQLLSILLSMPDQKFVVLSNVISPADYLLAGEIIQIGSVLRIYTKLTKIQDSSLITIWNLDLSLTPFIQELVITSSSTIQPDIYEPDTMDNPLAVEIGAPWVARTIHQGDEDWFSVSVETAGILILETSGSMDTFMELYDSASGSRLASDDDGGSNLNARIEYFAEPGKTYIAKVRGLGGDTGSYRFGAVLNAMPEDPTEPNETQEEAAPIELDTPVEGSFQTSSDVDWYKLDIPEGGGFLTVYTAGKLDTRITLHNEEGTILADDDDSGYGLNARVSILIDTGTVYIRVIEVDGQQGFYTLYTLLREPGASDMYEPDNTPETAKEIEVGTTQERTFTLAEDVDWVTFTVAEAGYYEIRTISAGRNLDTYIELYNEEGEYIDDDDDSGEHFDAYLKVLLDPGIYFIMAGSLDDDPLDNNAYTLSVSASNE